MKSIFQVAILCVAIAAGASGQFIYSNGPLITHPGGGFGGADGSALDTVPPSALGTFGYNMNAAALFRMADDFTVPCGEIWTLNSIKLFGYQTNSGTAAPTMTTANYRVWAAQPGSPGATVLFDYSGANQMTGVAFPSPLLYRATIATIATSTARPVQEVTMGGNGITLIPGTYWLDWTMTGTIASGPWQPAISILGTPATGNGLQETSPGTWTALLDGAHPQGLPFVIDHSTSFFNCFQLNITQAGPGGMVTLSDTGGIPGFTAINVITLNQGIYPNGWLFGVDIPLFELAGVLTGGPPFVVTFPPS
jgi:hypothetical protein